MIRLADVKWIKICTDIFDDEKILLIESMPENDSLIVIWFKLLCMAGKQNNGGVFMINDKLAYTDEMLATIFRRPLNTVRLALKTFEMYGMIEIVEGTVTIPNWEKHQSLGKLEKLKEQNRKRVAAHREKQKLIAENSGCNDECNDSCNVTVMECNATDKIREDKNRVDYEHIKDMFNDICISFPRVVTLSESRKKAIKARLNTYTVEQFRQVFTKAEGSDFLKGRNNRNWSAKFDWLIQDSNFAKVLDGNYDNENGKGYNSNQLVEINGKKYEYRNGKYYTPGGCGIAVDPYKTIDPEIDEIFG